MNKKTPEWFIRADNTVVRIYKYISYVAAVCLIAIMLIAFFDVIGEKLAKAGAPISGIPNYADWIAYLHVPIVFLSCGFITIERGHTCVDILTNRLHFIVQRIAAYLGMVMGIAITGLMTWRGFTTLLVEMIKYHTTINTSSFSFPQWPFTLSYCIGMLLLMLSFVWALLRLVFRYAPPAPVDPAMEPDPEGGDLL